jgi:hypothetical protein
MGTSNIIYVDFRFSKDIRERQVISFAERMRESSERTQGHLRAAKSALEQIKAMTEKSAPDGPGRTKQAKKPDQLCK